MIFYNTRLLYVNHIFSLLALFSFFYQTVFRPFFHNGSLRSNLTPYRKILLLLIIRGCRPPYLYMSMSALYGRDLRFVALATALSHTPLLFFLCEKLHGSIICSTTSATCRFSKCFLHSGHIVVYRAFKLCCLGSVLYRNSTQARSSDELQL